MTTTNRKGHTMALKDIPETVSVTFTPEELGIVAIAIHALSKVEPECKPIATRLLTRMERTVQDMLSEALGV